MVVSHSDVVTSQHWVVPGTQTPVQAPPLHTNGHVVDDDSYRQPCASVAQVAKVEVVAQVFPAAVHVEVALHVHAATPALVVQLWCAPQATAAP
ncbi:MAG: hypothetical protein ABSC94_26240 [Polyangiaceae bacterium]|jgi:hypothetical protein